LNSWPLAWMNYDTAVPASGFAIRQVMSAIGIFGLFAVLLTITFMAAETLSRRAFPHHVQLWKVWSPNVASSPLVFGETVLGYLLVAPFFAYEIVLYFFAQEKLGWWTPSDTLVNPDMFANYVPSLSALAQAAQAGFWEECLFRAAPLAVAAGPPIRRPQQCPSCSCPSLLQVPCRRLSGSLGSRLSCPSAFLLRLSAGPLSARARGSVGLLAHIGGRPRSCFASVYRYAY